MKSIKKQLDDYLEKVFPKGEKFSRRGEALVLIGLAHSLGKESVLEVLRKYPISANFDDAMDVLKFKGKIKQETLAKVEEEIQILKQKEVDCMNEDEHDEQILEHTNQIEMANKIISKIRERDGE